MLARQVRDQLDQLGATQTRIVVSGDLDEFSIAALRAEPVDSYGVGTSLVTGSGAPTASMVYKLVEVDGMPVQKRSSHKESHGGRKEALRLARATGTITEEVVYPAGRPPETTEPCRVLTTPLVRGGEAVFRPEPVGSTRAGGFRPAEPAVGGPELIARRACDPDDADPGLSFDTVDVMSTFFSAQPRE